MADIRSGWPVRSNSVDLVASIFVPKNFTEIARVLRPSGVLAMAFPGARHFQELRRDFNLLSLSEKKSETYAARIAAYLAAPTHQRITRRAAFDHDDLWNAVLMGPNARHVLATREGPARMSVTIDIEFLFARKPRLTAPQCSHHDAR